MSDLSLYPSAFLRATDFTLSDSIEGGYVFDPLDPGGETNRGITDRADGKIDRMVDLDRDGKGDVPIKDITHEHALLYYFQWYWRGLCDGIEDSTYAALLFDCSVNHGYARAKQWKALHKNTLSLLKHREQFFKDIVAHKPTQKRFINGWLNRIDHFAKHFNIKYKTTR